MIEKMRGDSRLEMITNHKTNIECRVQEQMRPVLREETPPEPHTSNAVEADRDALRRILRKEIPRTHRQGIKIA